MVSIKDTEPQALVDRVAGELEKLDGMKPPQWSGYVKTGVHKERPPTQDNWWYIRSASMLRKLYLKEAVGVSRLRTEYGGRKNRGHKPEHKARASGAVIRNMLQQLEKEGLVKTVKGKGRSITPKGMSMLDKATQNKA